MTVTKASEGTVTPTSRGFLLRFERRIAYPVQDVWRALTEEHAQWLSGDGAEIELRVGGKIRMPAHSIETTVVELDPPRVFAHGWDSPEWGEGGVVRWELEPDGEGTRLVLTHEHPPIDATLQDELAKKMNWPDEMKRAVPRTLAGWHMLLDLLEQHVEGRVTSSMPSPDDPGAGWQRVFEHYLGTVEYDGMA